MCKSPCSLLIWLTLFMTGNAWAQSRFTPSTVRIGTDLIGIGSSIANPKLMRFEVNADTDIHKYFAAFDFGYANLDRTGSDFTYQSTGSYFRVGPDVNVLPPDEFGNTVFFGIRYARSFFNDQLTINQTDNNWGSIQETLKNQGVQASWGEFVAGVKIQVVSRFYLGFTGHYKFGVSAKGGDFAPYEVPGFGTTAKTSAFGFNYHLFYRIKFRNKPQYIKPKKKEEPPEEQ